MDTTQEQAVSKTPVLKTLLVSDLVGSTRLVEELGDHAAAELGQRHDRLARDVLVAHEGREIDKTDGFLLLFERPLAAVRYALEYHSALRRLSEEEGRRIEARVGIHLGEVLLHENPQDHVARGAKPLEVEGLAKPTTGRLMSLAAGGQTLLTRGAFDLARRAAVGVPDAEALCWLAHGGYLLQGVAEAVEVFEVGREGVAPLLAPEDSMKVQRVVEQTTIPGWRPASGLTVPHRDHWVVEEKLGEGGFGEVWLVAHRKTRDKRVFKFCYDPASLRTLQREITLFRLLKEELGNRDDISRIIDWSFDEAPYFIESEYTEGGNLVDWAEEQGGLAAVPLAERLEIVAQVATALAAAHSVGVLHKDVKPSNVLIATATGQGGRPRARLSDFGVGVVTEAKRLADAGITVLGLTARTEVSSTPTSTSGTRLYTAPEVLEGKPATLQADIYALGLMLYQVVVGDLYRALAPGWRRQVADELLAEDIAVAVDGSPERRLGNARRLAERLRTLDSRQEERQAERRKHEEEAKLRSALKQARKRRRVWAVAVLVLALFSSAMTMMVFRVRSEAQRAERVAVFLAELFEIADPYGTSDPGAARGTAMTVRELIDLGRDKLESSFEDDPRTRGRLMGTLGVIYQSLGHYEEAKPLLEEALALRRQTFGDEHPDVAASLRALAMLRWHRGDHWETETLFRQALRMRRRLLGDEHPDLAESLHDLGWFLHGKGSYEGSESLYREALYMRRRRLGDEHPDVATSLNSLAMLLQDKGDYTRAEPLYREALHMRRRRLGDEHPDVAASLNSIAWLLQDKGDHKGAEPLYREALQMRRRLLGDEHPDVATSLNFLASLLQDKGDHEEAEPLFRESTAMARQLLGDGHPFVAISLNNLASVHSAKGDYSGAESLVRESLAMAMQLLGEEHPFVATLFNNLANLLQANGDYTGAEPLCRKSLEMKRRLLGDEHPDVATNLNDLASLLIAKGDYAGAEPLCRQSLAMKQRLLGDEHPSVATSLNSLARLLQAKGDYAGAEQLCRESLEMRRRLLGDEHPSVATSLNSLADLLRAKGDYAGAEQLCRESLEMRRRLLGDEHPSVAISLNNLARSMVATRRITEAAPLIDEALEIFRRTLPPNHWRIPNAESLRGSVLTALGRYQEAEPLLVASYPIVRDSTGERSQYTRDALKRLAALYNTWGRPKKAAEYRALLAEAGGSP
ncbi:MAG: tetratricopeptide repeat protein [Acidobacteriota bacterium]